MVFRLVFLLVWFVCKGMGFFGVSISFIREEGFLWGFFGEVGVFLVSVDVLLIKFLECGCFFFFVRVFVVCGCLGDIAD